MPVAVVAEGEGSSASRLDMTALQRNASLRPNTRETVLAVSGFSYLNDRESLLDDLLETRDAAFELEADVRRLSYRPGDEQPLIDLLKSMDGNAATARAGLALHLADPLLADNWALSLSARTRFAGRFFYEEGDEDKLRLAPLLAFIDLAELESRVRVSGVGLGELALHRRLNWLPNTPLQFAVSFKHQEIWLFERDVRVQRYRESDLFKLSEFTREHSRPNLDISVASQWRNWQLGLVLRDLVETTLSGPQGATYHLRTRAELQADYAFDWGRVSLDHDLSPRPAFGDMRGRRETRLALDFPVSQRFNLGLAYEVIARDRDDNIGSVSLGYALLDSFHLRFTGSIANGRELGGAFQIQVPLF